MVGGKGVNEDGETITESVQLVQSTRRKRQEERQSEGKIIIGVRKRLGEIGVGTNVNGVQERRLRVEGEIWRIMTVYKE